MARTTARMTRARRRNRQIDRVTLIVLIAFLVVASVTAVLAFILVRNTVIAWTTTPLDGRPGSLNAGGPGQGGVEGNVPAPTGPLQRETGPTPVPWDGNSRVTLLVMGMDYRDWEDGTDIPRTDSMILVSIDPLSMTAGMLSIPRDTWINVPGMGYNKINTAYRWGEVYQLPGGGPGLAMQTVEQFLGVPVDYYALIDFNAFVRFIDEMGGLDMHIQEEIVVDPIGPGNTRTLEPGVQTLDGATVLAYARLRSTDHDDFDRSRRQQEVIMAIRDQVLTFNMLPTLVSKAPRLYQEISAGISTNLTLNQIIQLAMLASQVPEQNIKKGVIGPPKQVEITTNPDDGQSILLPIPDQIRILRDEIFASGGPVAPRATQQGTKTQEPTAPANTEELMKEENARVIVKNGTSTEGLATKTGALLQSLGVNVLDETNADEIFPTTTIYDYTGKPSTIKFLMEKLNLPNARLYYNYDPNADADIVIILGTDWAEQQ